MAEEKRGEVSRQPVEHHANGRRLGGGDFCTLLSGEPMARAGPVIGFLFSSQYQLGRTLNSRSSIADVCLGGRTEWWWELPIDAKGTPNHDVVHRMMR